jgi:hypothetical protein
VKFQVAWLTTQVAAAVLLSQQAAHTARAAWAVGLTAVTQLDQQQQQTQAAAVLAGLLAATLQAPLVVQVS